MAFVHELLKSFVEGLGGLALRVDILREIVKNLNYTYTTETINGGLLSNRCGTVEPKLLSDRKDQHCKAGLIGKKPASQISI